jgi:hypothetical protein
VPVSIEHPIGEDQEEPIFEEEDTQFIEEGKWTSPSAFSSWTYITAYLNNVYLYMLLCIYLMGNHLFKDMTRVSPLSP